MSLITGRKPKQPSEFCRKERYSLAASAARDWPKYRTKPKIPRAPGLRPGVVGFAYGAKYSRLREFRRVTQRFFDLSTQTERHAVSECKERLMVQSLSLLAGTRVNRSWIVRLAPIFLPHVTKHSNDRFKPRTSIAKSEGEDYRTSIGGNLQQVKKRTKTAKTSHDVHHIQAMSVEADLPTEIKSTHIYKMQK